MIRVGVVGSFLSSERSGGVIEAIRALSRSMTDSRRTHVTVFGLRDSLSSPSGLFPTNVRCLSGRTYGPKSFGFSSGLANALSSHIVDLFHLHGLWMYPSIATCKAAAKHRVPYVISCHGMLDRWALQNSSVKKWIAAAIYERRNLNSAACLHALCSEEYRAMRAFGLTNPICIIPNGVDLPDETTSEGFRSYPPSGEKRLIYLGRLHPKKNLPALLKAWKLARSADGSVRNWKLVIAGWDQAGYRSHLESLARELNVSHSVEITGPKLGPEKTEFYKHAMGFVLPSLSEGLPMVVLEAWASSIPVLMTSHCNIPQGFTSDAAIEIGSAPDSISEGIVRMCSLPDRERQVMGANGRKLVERQFSWNTVASELSDVYSWLCGTGPKPRTVFCVGEREP